MKVTLYGSSDDLIEIEGDLREEFYLTNDDDGDFIAFSDGTLARIAYAVDGVWVIQILQRGTAEAKLVSAEGADEENYSDRLTLKGQIDWVVQGNNVCRS